jgi:threonine/homoserine/homoserine lactone efflux protein
MPWSMRRLLVHIVLAIAVVYLVGPAMAFVASSSLPAAGLACVFGVAFPVLIYEFLVGVWLIRLAQASGAGFRS